jgi:hypothetical protein
MSKTIEELAKEYVIEKYFKYVKRQEDDNYELLVEDFIAGYQAAVPQWISVKDKLPEEGQDCVIYVDWVDVWDKGSERITYQEIAQFNGDDRFYHRAHTELNRVTYWMPLPKPPQDK